MNAQSEIAHTITKKSLNKKKNTQQNKPPTHRNFGGITVSAPTK